MYIYYTLSAICGDWLTDLIFNILKDIQQIYTGGEYKCNTLATAWHHMRLLQHTDKLLAHSLT